MLTECIQNYDHDHNQNYVNANHAHNQNHEHSQNNGWQKIGRCDYTNHVHKQPAKIIHTIKMMLTTKFIHAVKIMWHWLAKHWELWLYKSCTQPAKIIHTVRVHHPHSQIHAHRQSYAHNQNYTLNQKACSQSASKMMITTEIM